MSDERRSYIGADLGGTKLLIGEITENGEILRTYSYPTGRISQRKAIEIIASALDDFIKESVEGFSPCAVGVGLMGRTDNCSGIWHEIDPSMCEETAAAELLSAHCSLPVFIDNDVRSATKAEIRFGCGADTDDMIYLNVGTGIAAGFVSGGRILTGSHVNCGEVGHTASGISLHVHCPCGRDDCVEMVAAGVGIDASARLLQAKYPDTLLTIPAEGRVKAEDVFRLYKTDRLCAVLIENAADALANLIMNLVRFNDPDTVVLGGGMITNGILYEMILERLVPEAIRFVSKGIVVSRLNPAFTGLLGAACNAIIGMEEQE